MDDDAFTSIDGKLFTRLHWGPLAPINVQLKDGRTLTGELLAVSRHGGVGNSGGAPSGEIWLIVAGDRTSVYYDQILDIQ
ncbi:hypothetical protein [Candidatus Viadribacter manganicus]|uniref:Uncharacterized protein n=1 Tax=Candidatus Viadribacter manganicus TaxID=1759059 RepID=A0A1B1ALZ1_9PROT|nr:hypothetical protein [Candidatus Viadribacter manganicus]ANP47573.1 hypothetical protein ATE48_17530 [Candidatus Viadribacter manganicus]